MTAAEDGALRTVLRLAPSSRVVRVRINEESDGVAPGYWDEDDQTITLNLADIPHPESLPNMSNWREFKAEAPSLFGVLAHEAGHARATRWRSSVECAPWEDACSLLEEPRVERLIAGRLGNRYKGVLRASAMSIALRDILASASASRATALSVDDALRILALGTGRYFAGVLTKRQATKVERAALAGIDRDRMEEARYILWDAVRSPGYGGDHAAIAERWAALYDGAGKRGIVGSAAVRAIAAALSDVEGDLPVYVLSAVPEAEEEAESGEVPASDEDAESSDVSPMFSIGDGDYTIHGAIKPPSPRALSWARDLRAAWEAEQIPAVHVVTQGQYDPTGARLDAADYGIGRAVGTPAILSTAWLRDTVTVETAPPTKVGLMVDVSGSMYEYVEPSAEAVFAAAAAASGVRATFAAVYFGSIVEVLAKPGDPAPRDMRLVEADHGTEHFKDAAHLIEGMLSLDDDEPANVRIIVVSDLQFGGHGQSEAVLASFTKWRQAGAHIDVVTPSFDTTQQWAHMVPSIAQALPLATLATSLDGVVRELAGAR